MIAVFSCKSLIVLMFGHVKVLSMMQKTNIIIS